MGTKNRLTLGELIEVGKHLWRSIIRLFEEGAEETLSSQGILDVGVKGVLLIDPGNSGKHVQGHNNISEKSQWIEGQIGIAEAQAGWINVTALQDGTHAWDTGNITGQNGETGVRVHQDSKGNIQGYPVDINQYIR